MRNHALVDGNKRLGLATLLAFLGINGRRLDATNDAAYGLIVSVATGTADVDAIAAWVAENAERASPGRPVRVVPWPRRVPTWLLSCSR
ncbi:MAG: hypothetical protein U0Q14_04990 [Dermatophilaceae bacterium]